MRSLWNWSRLWGGEKKSQHVIKEWQFSQKKSWNFQKETQPCPSLLPSPLHTPTHIVFVGCSDNNGSWRSRDRRLQTLTALCYVMNVWLPALSTLHQYGATNFTPCSMWTEPYICNKIAQSWAGGHVHKNNRAVSKCTCCFCSFVCRLLCAKVFYSSEVSLSVCLGKEDSVPNHYIFIYSKGSVPLAIKGCSTVRPSLPTAIMTIWTERSAFYCVDDITRMSHSLK